MAKYKVTYTCGHVETVQLYGPEKDRQRKLEWMRTCCLCNDCYRAQQREEATEKAAKLGLPELTGTEKQVAWTLILRDKALQKFEDFRAELVSHNVAQEVQDTFDAITADIKTQTEARWWIDRRDYSANGFIREYQETHEHAGAV